MKPAELRELSAEELRAKGAELRGQYFEARVKKVTGQLESTAQLRSLRRDIARVETLLRSRAGGGETS